MQLRPWISRPSRYAQLAFIASGLLLLSACNSRYGFAVSNEGSQDIENAVLTSADKTLKIGDIPRGRTKRVTYNHFGTHDTDVHLKFERGGQGECYAIGNFTAYLFWVEVHDHDPIVIRDAEAVSPVGEKEYRFSRCQDLPNPDGSPRR